MSVFAEENADIQEFVIWREGFSTDEVTIYTQYMKHKDYGRCIDIFLFSEDLKNEISSQDKSCGFRWNPYGYFVKKDMYFYDTKLYKHMKVCINNYMLIGYASKNGNEWEELVQIPIPDKYVKSAYKIGIHAYFGKNYFEIWKNMNFIQLLYNADNEWKGIYLDYYFFPRKNVDNGYGYYTAFLEVQYDTTYDALDLFSSMHDYIHWNIQHYYYLSICLDEFFVQGRRQYERDHYNHYNLFYGYDDEKQVYYVMGYGSSSKPIVSEIPYAVFENKDIITSEKLIRFKYAANDVTDLRFNINVVKTAVSEFLNSRDSAEKFANLLTQEPVSYGLEIFKILATEESEKKIYSDIRIAYCILEHSKIMRERLDYLLKNMHIKETDYEKLVKQSNAIVLKANLIMNLVIKGLYKKKEYPMLITYLLEIYELNKVFFTDLLKALD